MKKVLLILLLAITSTAFCQTVEPLVYVNNKFRIELKIQDEKSVLKNGKINQITITTKNMDTRFMTCSAPGLRLIRSLDAGQTENLWEINLKNWEANKPYILLFNYKGKTRFSGQFEIPVEN